MIGGVNLYSVNQAYKQAGMGYSRPIQPQSNAPAFGYREEPQGIVSSLKDAFLQLQKMPSGLSASTLH